VLCGALDNHESVISDARSMDRRCLRCRQVFCRIDIEDGQQPLRAVAGVRAK
jgi:hypothetical protein